MLLRHHFVTAFIVLFVVFETYFVGLRQSSNRLDIEYTVSVRTDWRQMIFLRRQEDIGIGEVYE